METKHKILHTAFRLFLKNGFSQVSANAIIREAKVTKGSFYHYFKSREDLIYQVIHLFICPYFQCPSEQICSDGQDKIHHTLRDCCRLEISENWWEEMNNDITNLRNYQFLVFEGLKNYHFLAEICCECSRKRYALILNTLLEGKRQGVIAQNVDTQRYAAEMTVIRDGILMWLLWDENLHAKEQCEETFERIWNEIKVC